MLRPMLALDDAALARLCIGATRYQTAAARAALVLRFSMAADPPRRLANQRRRSMHARQRRRAKVRIYRLVLPDRTMECMITALIAGGLLSASEATDRQALERALARWFIEFSAEWAL